MSVEVLVNDRWSLRVPEHRAGHWQRNPTWEPERLESMAANLKPGMVVYDLGAEQGDLSALFARWVREVRYKGAEMVARDGAGREVNRWHEPDRVEIDDSGGIVLVEPAPWYWPTIRATFEANDLPTPIATFAGFVSDESRPGPGRQAVWAPSAWPLEAQGEPTGREGFRHVRDGGQALTIDDVASFSVPPDAITMDIEGAEILAIRGAQRTLAEHRPLVWVSVHAEAMFHDHGVYQAEFHSMFHRHGYEKCFLGFDHEWHVLYYPSEKRDQLVFPTEPLR